MLRAGLAGFALSFVAIALYVFSEYWKVRGGMTSLGYLASITIWNYSFWSLALASFAFGFFLVSRTAWTPK